MIGADLERADLESRMASWAASAISDDAAAVRAVIEAHGDRLAAADVAGVVSQYTGNAAVMQPELETVVGSQQPERSRSACNSRCRSSQEGAAPASSESATRIRARSASACGRRARRGSGYADVCLPARTGAVQVDVGAAGAVRVPALGAPALLAVTAPRPPAH